MNAGIHHPNYRVTPAGGLARGFWIARCKKCGDTTGRHGHPEVAEALIVTHLNDKHGEEGS